MEEPEEHTVARQRADEKRHKQEEKMNEAKAHWKQIANEAKRAVEQRQKRKEEQSKMVETVNPSNSHIEGNGKEAGKAAEVEKDIEQNEFIQAFPDQYGMLSKECLSMRYG